MEKPHTKAQRAEFRRAFSERVRARIVELGITPAELARRIDVGPTHLSGWINRGRMPDGYFLPALSAKLEATTDFLLGASADPQGFASPQFVDALRDLVLCVEYHARLGDTVPIDNPILSTARTLVGRQTGFVRHG